jgi:Bacterial capsule synthesis protein PGA_cap
MRNNLRTLYAAMAIGAFAVASCQNAPSDNHAEKATTNTPTKDSIPVLVLRGWMNGHEAVSSSEIRTGLQNGWVKITADLTRWVKDKFNVQGQVINKEDYPFASDSLLLLTTIDSTDGRWLACSVDGSSFFTSPSAYRLFCASTHPFRFDEAITSYTHTGVTAITRQAGVVVQRTGTDAYLQNLMPYFQQPEIVHISNEVSAVDSCSYGRMKMSFATRTEHFALLEKLGADIIELTGNHNLDFGEEPYLKSLQWYTEHGMQYFGGGASPDEAKKPLIRTLKDGSKVAWIGFNERCPCGECADREMGANRWDSLQAVQTIDYLRNQEKVQFIIACVQYGESDSYAPTRNQRRISHLLMDLGVDVMIGSQAHQPQEVAIYKNKMVFYGIGNFLFDQIHRIGVRQAFFLQCYFYKGKIIQYQPVYTFMGSDRIPQIATEEERQGIREAVLRPDNFPYSR